ncbi:MAG: UV damage repair endonuclease UvsE [Euryarchaeota archaeon]|nr:UV damage repair endonuclease UvsE [Euryarchaeota archaeon]|tara:strand:+ start:39806 stop:40729 length:924 start_codon:yes stop_codon:yes gene_type:complete
MRLGYACINETLTNQGIKANRTAIRRTFLKKGVEHMANIGLQSSIDLLKILQWNEENNIKVFRISSNLFPWASEYDLETMPHIDEIRKALGAVGQYAREHNHRLSFHPGQFNCMASPTEKVVRNSIKDLEIHGKIMDFIGMPRTRLAKINIHIGGAYGDRDSAMDRFCKNIQLLSPSVLNRLTVENDDKPNCYSTLMLYKGVFERTGIPIVFDSHHFTLGPQDQDYEEAIKMAASTWGTVRPVCHHSNSRKKYEDEKASAVSHSQWYYEPFDNCDLDVDVVLECKKKELALKKYRNDFGNEMTGLAS